MMPTHESAAQFSGVLKNIFRDLTDGPKQKNTRLVDLWQQIMDPILGPGVTAKTNVRFGKERIVITTASSALAYELSQKYGSTILKRFQNEFGENEVKTVKFFVGENR